MAPRPHPSSAGYECINSDPARWNRTENTFGETFGETRAACDQVSNSTAFTEFLLSSLRTALREIAGHEFSDAQVSEQVAKILRACSKGPKTKAQLLESAGLANAYLNDKRHILPLLRSGVIEMIRPGKPVDSSVKTGLKHPHPDVNPTPQ